MDDRWDTGTADAYEDHHIMDHPEVWEGLANILLPHSKGKRVADLGCAGGKLSDLLQASECANVDPYPPSNPTRKIIAMDGVEYLKSCKEDSLDLVVSVFAVHFMDRAKLDNELARVLSKGGRAIWVSTSTASTFFGNKAFNESFFSVGFEKSGAKEGETAPTTRTIERAITHKQMSDFVTKRTWSNLVIMPQSQIDYLASEIPKDLSRISIAIDFYENVF